MEIITKLMDVEESFLTDYGVINIAGKEYLISDLEKDFEKSKEQVINFNFDKNNGCFVLSLKKDDNSTITHRIKLSSKQIGLLKQGILDSEVDRIINIIAYKQTIEAKEELNRTVIRTGMLPTDSEEIKLYYEYLQEELKKTKAYICSDYITIISSLLIVSPMFALAYHFAIDRSDLFVADIIPIAIGIFVLIATAKIPKGKSLKEDKEARTILLTKLKKMKEIIDNTNASSIEEKMTIEGKEIANIVLRQARLTQLEIAKLPENEREKYYAELNEKVLVPFTERTSAIVNKEKNAADKDVESINNDLLPIVLNIYNEVRLQQTGFFKLISDSQEVREALEYTINSSPSEYQSPGETSNSGPGFVKSI